MITADNVFSLCLYVRLKIATLGFYLTNYFCIMHEVECGT